MRLDGEPARVGATVSAMSANEQWKTQAATLGGFIRAQRMLAELSLREMSTMTNISNAYLSQVERGLHQPSVRVLSAIAEALQLPADELLAHAGLQRSGERGRGPAGSADGSSGADAAGDLRAGQPGATEAAILADPALTPEQRGALLGVYRSFVPPAS
jgi:transcriptional regulator with XRE-family HTH domain